MALLFFDGPEKPPIFDLFDGLPTTLDNVGTKSFPSFIRSFPSYLALNARGTFATISTSEISERFLDAVKQEADVRYAPVVTGQVERTWVPNRLWQEIGKIASLHSGTTVSFDVEPFTPYGQYATDSAFPHADSPLPVRPTLPIPTTSSTPNPYAR